jgi:long-chain acyl-CoA synthetase
LTVVGDRHLARLAEQSFERLGDFEALVFEGTAYRSGELFERSRRLAAGLAELGIAPGERVVVIMSNCPEVFVAYQALWRAGAAITPAVFLLPPAELRHILVDSEASAVLTTPEFEDTVRSAAEGVDTVRHILSVDDWPDADPAPIVPRADSDLAALMYTGGTTGRAKGVMLSHENLWHAGKGGHDAGYRPEITRGLNALPLSHSYGLLVTVVGFHSVQPGLAVLMRWFSPEGWLGLAARHRIQISAVVPSMIHLLLLEPLEEHDLSALRYIVSGAAPLSPEVARELERRIPGVALREGYGLTETSALVSSNPPDGVRLGSVGRPVPGTELRIVDDEDRELPRGEVGEICCRSPTIMLGYWRDPELTDAAMRGGWFHTGDLGYLDEGEYLYVVDRKKDLIIRGGFNVFPRDVEEALLEHPAIAVAAVVGRPDELHGEEVVAFVSLHSGAQADPEEIVVWSKRRLGGYKYPREVHVIDAVPLTPVGKVDRKTLRAQLAPST